jgi:hypothetical protein
VNKQRLIQEYLESPIKIGDFVKVRGLGRQDTVNWGNSEYVIDLHEDGIYIKQYNTKKLIKHGDYKKNPFFIGYNPFPMKSWKSELRIANFTLESILYSIGFQTHKIQFKTEQIGNIEVQELNWNPFIIDKQGNKVFYQRGFVWSLKDKQLLIESIYNNLDIGKIIIRKRDWKWVEKNVKTDPTVCFKDIVDGKQRLNAILSFIQDEFEDLNGYKYSELSKQAQNNFGNFSSVGYGELGENCTDEDVLAVFLNTNFTGVQMSQEHIDFVKSIKI